MLPQDHLRPFPLTLHLSCITTCKHHKLQTFQTLLLLSYLVHHQSPMFLVLLPASHLVTQLALVIQLPTVLLVEHHRLGLRLVSSGLIYQLNLRPQLTTANQGAPPAVISSHPFQLKFLTAAIKVCAGCSSGFDRGSPPKDLCLVRKNNIYITMLSMGGRNTQVYPMCIIMRTPIVLSFGALILIQTQLKYPIL